MDQVSEGPFEDILSRQDLVSRVILSPPLHSKITVATCEFHDSLYRSERHVELLRAGGAGTTRSAALKAAIGEGIERYAAVNFAESAEYFYGPAVELGCTDSFLSGFRWFSDEQYASGNFPFSPLNSSAVCKWYMGEKATTNEPLPLPGPFFAFPYSRRQGENRYTHSISTGLSFGSTSEQARTNGIFECIEREAISLAWVWGLPAREISSNDVLVRGAREAVELDDSVTLIVYEITTDLGLPVVAAFMFDGTPPNHNFFTTGCACRFELGEAVEKAVLEASQGIPYVDYLKTGDRLSKLPVQPEDVTTFENSAVFYSVNKALLASAMESRGGVLRTAVDDGRREYYSGPRDSISLSKYLENRGHPVYLIDMTPEWLIPKATVLRALIPTLQPLEGSFVLRSMKSDRPKQVAMTLNVDLSSDNLPHPLP